jgi:hypothetical protein
LVKNYLEISNSHAAETRKTKVEPNLIAELSLSKDYLSCYGTSVLHGICDLIKLFRGQVTKHDFALENGENSLLRLRVLGMVRYHGILNSLWVIRLATYRESSPSRVKSLRVLRLHTVLRSMNNKFRTATSGRWTHG